MTIQDLGKYCHERILNTLFLTLCKDNQMRSQSFVSGPKIHKAYEIEKCHFIDPHLNQIIRGLIEVTSMDLKPQSRLFEFLVQIKVMDFSFD